jgi:hypothetical protein
MGRGNALHPLLKWAEDVALTEGSRCFSKQDWAILAFSIFLAFLGALFVQIEKSSLKLHFLTRRVLFVEKSLFLQAGLGFSLFSSGKVNHAPPSYPQGRDGQGPGYTLPIPGRQS